MTDPDTTDTSYESDPLLVKATPEQALHTVQWLAAAVEGAADAFVPSGHDALDGMLFEMAGAYLSAIKQLTRRKDPTWLDAAAKEAAVLRHGPWCDRGEHHADMTTRLEDQSVCMAHLTVDECFRCQSLIAHFGAHEDDCERCTEYEARHGARYDDRFGQRCLDHTGGRL